MFGPERLAGLGVAAEEEVLRDVDIEAIDGVKSERDIPVHPDLPNRNRKRSCLDGVKNGLDPVQRAHTVHTP
ncbi:hypothetical protein GCM10008995_21890 [Halobellus salinus]|uniref:Uncharacterized protein n=1 Tax=Halobellus salinus TaxID=931585 RepID=A0A830EHT1_9EURY|nr:hypothetical protein GCM10008995_21890 [Halobellus salinus]